MATSPSKRTLQRHAEQRRLALLKAVGGSLRQPYPSPFQLSTKQEVFLRTPQLEAFFGGSAGPGKSTALLASALMYADEPGYAALLLRRTYPQLSMPGGLIPMSKVLFSIWARSTSSSASTS
jgi:hypothetical protein